MQRIGCKSQSMLDLKMVKCNVFVLLVLAVNVTSKRVARTVWVILVSTLTVILAVMVTLYRGCHVLVSLRPS